MELWKYQTVSGSSFGRTRCDGTRGGGRCGGFSRTIDVVIDIDRVSARTLFVREYAHSVGVIEFGRRCIRIWLWIQWVGIPTLQRMIVREEIGPFRHDLMFLQRVIICIRFMLPIGFGLFTTTIGMLCRQRSDI